jgi:ribosome-associated translation inhibitor RaiA
MWIDIRTRGMTLDADTRAHIDRRLGFALERVGDRVNRVNVYLADENGPRGGVDKVCRVVTYLRTGGAVLIEDEDSDLTTLIDRTADRLGHAVRRVLALNRTRRSLALTDHLPRLWKQQ